MSLTTRVNKLKSGDTSPEMGWADAVTHYAFAMHFGKDLVILHDIGN